MAVVLNELFGGFGSSSAAAAIQGQSPNAAAREKKFQDLPALIIHLLCNCATSRELKKYRMVSRRWNNVVSNHAKYSNTIVKFGKEWVKQAEIIDLDSITKWKCISLYNFNFVKAQYLKTYWPYLQDTLQDLRLEYTRVHCHDLANLINDSAALKFIKFNHVNFEPVHQVVEKMPADRNQPQHYLRNEPVQEVDVTFSKYCNHIENANAFVPKHAFGKPTITIIHITDQHIPLPMCVCLVLLRRSAGRLNKLVFENNPVTQDHIMKPTLQQMATQVAEIAQNSQTSLRSFSYNTNAGSNSVRLVGFLAENLNFQLLQLNELVLHEDVIGQGLLSIRDPMLRLLQLPRTIRNLVSLHIGYQFSLAFFQQISAALQPMASLRKLKLSLLHSQQQYNFEEFFEPLTQIVDLSIVDLEYLRGKGGQTWRHHRRLNYNVLQHIPTGLQSLEMTFFWELDSTQQQTDFFQRNGIQNLTKFELNYSRTFNDEMMGIIVTRLRFLEDIKITHAANLTDVGLTGFDTETCLLLLKCQCLSNSTVPDLQHSLLTLRHIKKLNFKGCSKLTDVSVRYAFVFKGLKSINLSRCILISDVGMVALGKNNPKLKELFIQDVYRVSHFGINLLITNSKSIRKIHTPDSCLACRNGPTRYTEHPLFHDIVSAKKVKDKAAF